MSGTIYNQWHTIRYPVNTVLFVTRVTNSDGRCSALISMAQIQPGTYRMHFDTAAYFATQNNLQPFYPYAEVCMHAWPLVDFILGIITS